MRQSVWQIVREVRYRKIPDFSARLRFVRGAPLPLLDFEVVAASVLIQQALVGYGPSSSTIGANRAGSAGARELMSFLQAKSTSS